MFKYKVPNHLGIMKRLHYIHLTLFHHQNAIPYDHVHFYKEIIKHPLNFSPEKIEQIDLLYQVFMMKYF